MSAHVVQGIETRFVGPTNSRGARIIATARKASSMGEAMRLTVSYDHGLGTQMNHAEAAKALAVKFGWKGTWFQGGSADESGYNFVCAGRLPVECEGSAFVVTDAD